MWQLCCPVTEIFIESLANSNILNILNSWRCLLPVMKHITTWSVVKQPSFATMKVWRLAEKIYKTLQRGGKKTLICLSPEMLLKLKGYLLMIFCDILPVYPSHSKGLSEWNPLTTVMVRSLSFRQSPFIPWLYCASPQLLILSCGCVSDHLVPR